MPPRTPLWPLQPHTIGKHRVLKDYLDVWLPVLGQSQERSLFIDAFAGPGEYTGGEEGSPLIALRAFHEHKDYEKIEDRVLFKFIEKERARTDYLENLLQEKRYLPSEAIEIINSTFDETLTGVLDDLKRSGDYLAPSFVMIDPFGFSDTPMELIGRILRNPLTEVYISFMYSFIDRFDDLDSQESNLNALYGSKEWKPLAKIADPEERKRALYGLYARRLREEGARYVLHFELYKGEQLEYAIFFGTSGLRGCDEMKKAIWKVDPTGDFRFRGSQVDQLFLGNDFVDFELFREQIRQEFRSRDLIPIREIEDFVKSDRTGFHSGHLRDHALIPMAETGEIQAFRIDGRKTMKQFPKGTVLRLGEPQGKQASLDL